LLCPAATRRRTAGRAMRLGASWCERDRPFETWRPGYENPDAGLGRVCGDPGFVQLSGVLPSGFHGHLDALGGGRRFPGSRVRSGARGTA
jgi:hypothetical protein